MKVRSIDVELARSLLEYRPDLGGSCLVWKTRRGGKATVGTPAGRIHVEGYWEVGIRGIRYRAHRLVWAITKGENPPCQIDHINGSRADNRIENLRLAPNNNGDNAQNRGKQTNNTSGFLGVSWHKGTGKWAAAIGIKRKKHYLGLFNTKEEAYEAYLKAKEQLHTFEPSVREV